LAPVQPQVPGRAHRTWRRCSRRCRDTRIGLPTPFMSPAAGRVAAPGGSSSTSLRRQPDARVNATVAPCIEVPGRTAVRTAVRAAPV